MDGAEGSPSHGGGPAESASTLGGSLLALVEARVELVAIELREEAERRKRLVVLGVAAAAFIGLALVMFSFLLVALFWETHRIAAIFAVTVLHSAIGAWAVARMRRLNAESPPPFSTTLAEFRKDINMLRGRHE